MMKSININATFLSDKFGRTLWKITAETYEYLTNSLDNAQSTVYKKHTEKYGEPFTFSAHVLSDEEYKELEIPTIEVRCTR